MIERDERATERDEREREMRGRTETNERERESEREIKKNRVLRSEKEDELFI